jgi:hypothetical protein
LTTAQCSGFFIFAEKEIMRTGLIALISVCLFWGCQPEAPAEQESAAEQVSIQDQMLGTWEVKLLRVEVDSYENTDSNFVFEVSEEYWERLYRVRPYRTYFAADSTFRTVRRNLNDQIVGEDRGLWRTFGDTLMLLQPNATLQYKVRLEKGQAYWAGLVDWDADGKEDDTYYAEHRFVGKTPNE